MRVITVDESTGKRVFSRKEVATLCGVSTQTISLWEKSGSIPASVRDENDYRYWDEDTVEKVKEYAGTSIKDRRKK